MASTVLLALYCRPLENDLLLISRPEKHSLLASKLQFGPGNCSSNQARQNWRQSCRFLTIEWLQNKFGFFTLLFVYII